MMERSVNNIAEMYSEMMILMSMQGVKEESRNGPVLSLPQPLTVTVRYPTDRILLDPIRCANPFFHAMEFVWMMAGSNEVEWIKQFNSRFQEYAEDDGIIHAAYGHRWRNHFVWDQIQRAVNMLSRDLTDRRVVLAMWDGYVDLGAKKNDLPCNTHVYLRVVDGALDFTVCNRSNDVVWGMTGANAVHMTMLQELMAAAIHVPVGKYRVFTNNAHVYTKVPGMEEMLKTRMPTPALGYKPTPLIQPGEPWLEFIEDCEAMVGGGRPTRNTWMKQVAWPMYKTYLGRKEKNSEWEGELDLIGCPQWRNACRQWVWWKTK